MHISSLISLSIKLCEMFNFKKIVWFLNDGRSASAVIKSSKSIFFLQNTHPWGHIKAKQTECLTFRNQVLFGMERKQLTSLKARTYYTNWSKSYIFGIVNEC